MLSLKFSLTCFGDKDILYVQRELASGDGARKPNPIHYSSFGGLKQ